MSQLAKAMIDNYGSDPRRMVAVFNPSMQERYTRNLAKVYTGSAPALATVAEAFGRDVAESWLMAHINDLSLFAGCKEKLGIKQVETTAQLMLSSYGHYKLTEFMLFFRRFKCAEYGRFYGAVDPMIVMEALRSFTVQRDAEIRHIRQKAEEEQKAQEEREMERIRNRYEERVLARCPGHPPLSLLQYRLMGYDAMGDDDLNKELSALANGEKKIPGQAQDILNLINNSQNENRI